MPSRVGSILGRGVSRAAMISVLGVCFKGEQGRVGLVLDWVYPVRDELMGATTSWENGFGFAVRSC